MERSRLKIDQKERSPGRFLLPFSVFVIRIFFITHNMSLEWNGDKADKLWKAVNSELGREFKGTGGLHSHISCRWASDKLYQRYGGEEIIEAVERGIGRLKLTGSLEIFALCSALSYCYGTSYYKDGNFTGRLEPVGQTCRLEECNPSVMSFQGTSLMTTVASDDFKAGGEAGDNFLHAFYDRLNSQGDAGMFQENMAFLMDCVEKGCWKVFNVLCEVSKEPCSPFPSHASQTQLIHAQSVATT